jgi:hypothetical protein
MIQRKLFLLLFIICLCTPFAIFSNGGPAIGIEFDGGFLSVTDSDTDLYSGPPSTMGLSIIVGLDRFLGMGLYSKFVLPQNVKHSSGEVKLGKDYGDFDAWLLDFLWGPVFTLARIANSKNQSAFQLMFCVGPHMALLHVDVPGVNYSESGDYFTQYNGLGANLTFQGYARNLYAYLRLQYSRDMYSGNKRSLRSVYPSFGVGYRIDP